MEYLSEDRQKLLLNKEWLVKIDNENSTPYLFKFYSSTVDLSCCIMITDMKSVWGEVLSSKQFARRWRDCNPAQSPFFTDESEEDEWRTDVLNLLSKAHALGGMEELSFDVVSSHNADLAFELGSDEFKWRWETYHQGPKVSAEILSKQLIMPLISVSHLAFTSAEPVSELSDTNLEKAVDKLGRGARRSVDTHIKHAISKPKLATTLRRMTAMFNFLPDLPPIITSIEESPNLHVPVVKHKSPLPHPSQAEPKVLSRLASPPAVNRRAPQNITKQTTSEPPESSSQVKVNVPADDDDSVTEEEVEEEDFPVAPAKTTIRVSSNITNSNLKERKSPPIPRETTSPGPSTRGSSTSSLPPPHKNPKRDNTTQSQQSSPEPDILVDGCSQATTSGSKASSSKGKSKQSDPAAVSDLDSSSPVRPAKKKRVVSSSEDEDSEAAERKRLQVKKSNAPKGAKQPLKRPGRRF
ncbi:hypothetical protein C8Q75DRAFT_884500 [Abortiporus biennis]|nr:hypothetical protein C8Q75DRAFT_884500 [Abortiporus biennis]